jgi:hypothetical protein
MLHHVLLLVVIGLIATHLFASPSRVTTEGFQSPAALSELEPEDDPRDLPWIASWSPADRAARHGQICAVTFTEEGPHGTTIQTVSKTCEAGMAHTRPGDRIVIPDSIPMPHRDQTIRHELIHIHQRRNPDAWRTFYRRSWSFQFAAAPPPGLPAAVKAARRSNPDTWDPATGGPWAVWQGRYWPLAIYTDPQTPRLREARTVWWDDMRQELLEFPPASWTAFFGSSTQPEHPHELAAVYLTAESRESEAARRLDEWWAAAGSLLWMTRESPE